MFLPLLLSVLLILPSALIFFLRSRWARRRLDPARHSKTLAFFHPYCNSGGGGERVLWTAVKAIQQRYPSHKIIIYTGDKEGSPRDILQNTKNRFGIELTNDVRFVYLTQRHLTEDKLYPRFTLLGQSLGSIVLAWEALNAHVPDVMIDTMGFAFTYPMFKFLGGCKVIAYVHYPTISSDMLKRVQERRPTYNNGSAIANSETLSHFKAIYYRILAWVYGACGSWADVVMVNSSWTRDHIHELWNVPRRTRVVFPPCSAKQFSESSLDGRKPWIVSIAQYRPEKDHHLQLAVFQKALEKEPELFKDAHLVFVGSSRNSEDDARVDELKSLVRRLDLESRVSVMVNVPFSEVRDILGKSSVGMHAMWNEHFGIGIVEYMAGGLIPLAHKSGGPKSDIVVPYEGTSVGFLAASVDEYVDSLIEIFTLKEGERHKIRQAARDAALARFNEERFDEGFLDAIKNCV